MTLVNIKHLVIVTEVNLITELSLIKSINMCYDCDWVETFERRNKSIYIFLLYIHYK